MVLVEEDGVGDEALRRDVGHEPSGVQHQHAVGVEQLFEVVGDVEDGRGAPQRF